MLYAIDSTGNKKAPAVSGERATCPSCKADVVAKCGTILTHHWAHVSKIDCDTWAEGETAWHRDWKSTVPPQSQEVVIGPHRADIQLASGMVIELQHSSISPAVVAERERFYNNMIWLFDATHVTCSQPDDIRACYCQWDSNDFGESKTYTCDRCRSRLHLQYTDYGVHIHWKHLPKSWFTAKCPIFIEIKDRRVLRITKIVNGAPKFGRIGSSKEFKEWISFAAVKNIPLTKLSNLDGA